MYIFELDRSDSSTQLKIRPGIYDPPYTKPPREKLHLNFTFHFSTNHEKTAIVMSSFRTVHFSRNIWKNFNRTCGKEFNRALIHFLLASRQQGIGVRRRNRQHRCDGNSWIMYKDPVSNIKKEKCPLPSPVYSMTNKNIYL